MTLTYLSFLMQTRSFNAFSPGVLRQSSPSGCWTTETVPLLTSYLPVVNLSPTYGRLLLVLTVCFVCPMLTCPLTFALSMVFRLFQLT